MQDSHEMQKCQTTAAYHRKNISFVPSSTSYPLGETTAFVSPEHVSTPIPEPGQVKKVRNGKLSF